MPSSHVPTKLCITFASRISVIEHDQNDLAGIHRGLLALLEITMSMFDGGHYEYYESSSLVGICVSVFMVAVKVFLVNMLVAQLTFRHFRLTLHLSVSHVQ